MEPVLSELQAVHDNFHSSKVDAYSASRYVRNSKSPEKHMAQLDNLFFFSYSC